MTKWMPVAGYEGLYQISDRGWMRTRDRRGEWVPKALNTDKNGYKRVTLSKYGEKRSRLVHHLVLEAFVSLKPPGMECRHLNGDPGDNRLKNLEWGTSSQNSFDVVRHGNHPAAKKTHCKNGHEFTPENTLSQSGGRGRACRTCNNERAAAWYAANKGQRQPNNKDKTHCKRGHEFTPENIIRRKDGGRECRTCNGEASRARYAANKGKRNANVDRTHCPQGHPYDEANTYRPPGTNRRMCKTCTRNRSREYQRNKRAKGEPP